MLRNCRTLVVVASLLAVSACSTKGDWMGADAEKAYDKELDAKRLASILNNDDYYLIFKDGRVYALSDAKDFTGLLKVGEVAKTVTKIGGGPNGERLVYGLTSTEAKAMESKVGFKGGAQEMYEGNRDGLEKGFFGVLLKDDRYVVTDSWAVAKQFKADVSPAKGVDAKAPDGKSVTYIVTGDLKDTKTRFEKLLQ